MLTTTQPSLKSIATFDAQPTVTTVNLDQPKQSNEVNGCHQLMKPFLKLGDANPSVTELQKLLTYWGTYVDSFSGRFDTKTQKAVKLWQHRIFLPENGVVDHLTWHSLYTGAPVHLEVIKLGSENKAVTTLQQVLRTIGRYTVNVSGKFDRLTDVAVRDFQMRQGLVVDGVVDIHTWRAISKVPH